MGGDCSSRFGNPKPLVADVWTFEFIEVLHAPTTKNNLTPHGGRWAKTYGIPVGEGLAPPAIKNSKPCIMERGTPPLLCAPDLQKIYSAKEVEKR